MIFLTKDMKPDVDKMYEYLTEQPEIYMDKYMFLSMIAQMSAIQDSRYYWLCNHLYFRRAEGTDVNHKDNVGNYLYNREIFPDNVLLTAKGNWNLSADNIKKRMLPLNICNTFLNTYMEYNSYKSKISTAKKIMERRQETVGLDRQGRPFIRIPYQYTITENLRFYTADENIQALPKEFLNTMVARPGKFLIWADFDQFEFSLMMQLMLEFTDEQIEKISSFGDRYKGFAYIASKLRGVPFDEEKFKQERPMYKEGVIARGYNASKATVANSVGSMEIASAIDAVYSKNDNYMRIIEYIDLSKQLNLPVVVNSYFGTTNSLDLIKYGKSLYSKAVNTPIQTTASEIFILVVNSILDKLRGFGLTSDDVRIYYGKHDEYILECSEKVIPYLWVIKEHSKIQIDDWLCLGLDPHLGYNYKVDDEELTRKFNEVSDKALKEGLYKDYIPRGEKKVYSPVRKIKRVGITVDTVTTGEQEICIATLVDFQKKQYAYLGVPSMTKEEIVYNMAAEYAKLDQEFKAILVNTLYVPTEAAMSGDTFLKFTDVVKIDIKRTNVFSYAKIHGFDSLSESDKEYFSGFEEIELDF